MKEILTNLQNRELYLMKILFSQLLQNAKDKIKIYHKNKIQ